MEEGDVCIICFEIKEGFNRYESIEVYLNDIENNYRKDTFKDCYLVMCKYDEFVFHRQQGGLSGNEIIQNEIKELIDIEVN